MILLDTDVLSEFMRPEPAPEVVAWLDAQVADQVWISALTRAEVELGVALLPDGQRKEAFRAAARAMFEEDFAGRCLPFDERAASRYAAVMATCMRLGRPISVEDAQIAAVALSNGLALATRNVGDFEVIEGLEMTNPWETAP